MSCQVEEFVLELLLYYFSKSKSLFLPVCMWKSSCLAALYIMLEWVLNVNSFAGAFITMAMSSRQLRLLSYHFLITGSK